MKIWTNTRYRGKGEAMVTDKYIDSLGIDEDKAEALKTALRKDSFYRKCLHKAGIYPTLVEKILQLTDTSKLDESQPEITIEKARVEWAEYIPKNKR